MGPSGLLDLLIWSVSAPASCHSQANHRSPKRLERYCALFWRWLPLEQFLGALTRCLSPLQIDLLSPLTHVCQNYHTLWQNLHITPVDGEHEFFSLLPYDHYSLSQQRHKRLMVGEYPQLPFGTRDKHLIHVTSKQLTFWAYNS
jgi:hypothetical protein